MKILVTGAAGFIGFHLCRQLIARGEEVLGLDNINDYYDVNLKHGRLAELGIATAEIANEKIAKSRKHNNFRFIKANIENKENILKLFADEAFDTVCHLAAQAGVRYSVSNPDVYIQSNIVGYFNILEACRYSKIKHLIYASSASVYGLNQKMPFGIEDPVNHPISLYAASKKSNELMAHSYTYLYGIPTTGLRFFTVYGPWGRPDMALFIFTKAILEGRPIDVYNNGVMRRDFTYVNDTVGGVLRVIDKPSESNKDWNAAEPDAATSMVPYNIYNIGNSNPVNLLEFIEAIEEALGKKAVKNMLPMQQGDIPAAWADVGRFEKKFDFRPQTKVKDGIQEFVKWYRTFYKV